MMKTQPLKFAVWALAGVALTACKSKPEMDEQMRQDLQAASTSSFELAPAGQGLKVVSAIEQVPQAQPRPQVSNQPAPQKKAPRPTNKVAEPSEPAAAAPRTLPASSVSPPPPGGYKGLGDVIKNAPFPIKP
jgi:hypothetical protein